MNREDVKMLLSERIISFYGFADAKHFLVNGYYEYRVENRNFSLLL